MSLVSCGGRFLALFVVAPVVVLVAACGGGGGAGPTPPVDEPLPPLVMGTSKPADARWKAPAGAVPATGNYVYLEGDADEAIGRGKTYLYTEQRSTILMSSANSRFSVKIGDAQQQWTLEFVMQYPLRAGLYSDARKPELRVSSNEAGLDVKTEGRECAVVDGWFVVDEVVPRVGERFRAVLRFGLRCVGARSTLHGQIRWDSVDARRGPVASPPAGLWRPAETDVAAQGSFVYLESDDSDYVGRGRQRLYTRDNAQIELALLHGGVSFYNVSVAASEVWSGNFIGILGHKLSRGYYPGIQRYPYYDAGIGAMEWQRDRMGCSLLNGWFVVDEVEYVGDALVHVDLRFEQRCGLASAKLRGRVRWTEADFVRPAAPVDPAPAALWQPPAGATPDAGDYLYVQSEAGDRVGQGQSRLYTAADAVTRGAPFGRGFELRVAGAVGWTGTFRTMSTIPVVAAGYYPEVVSLTGSPGEQAAQQWTADGRTCTDGAHGWVVVDGVARNANGTLTSIEMRFEQRCVGDGGALRGKLRWTADTPSAVLSPAPSTLWRPPARRLPAEGNYVYVESDLGDPIGRGRWSLDTPANALLVVQGTFGADTHQGLYLSVRNGDSNWYGDFYRPLGDSELRRGLYGNLLSTGASTLAGGLRWSGNATNCAGNASGWYAVDDVEYIGAELTSIQLRFEQRCNDFGGSLRGAIRWSASDNTRPATPLPVPADLWQPDVGATPAVGSYVYLDSGYGDFVGLGKQLLFTSANASITAVSPSNQLRHFAISVNEQGAAGAYWNGNFEASEQQAELTPGLYSSAQRWPFQSPARPGIDFDGDGRGCNTQSGWFAVDRVRYAGGELQEIELRFEQHCERRSAPLRGKIRWARG